MISHVYLVPSQEGSLWIQGIWVEVYKQLREGWRYCIDLHRLSSSQQESSCRFYVASGPLSRTEGVVIIWWLFKTSGRNWKFSSQWTSESRFHLTEHMIFKAETGTLTSNDICVFNFCQIRRASKNPGALPIDPDRPVDLDQRWFRSPGRASPNVFHWEFLKR